MVLHLLLYSCYEIWFSCLELVFSKTRDCRTHIFTFCFRALKYGCIGWSNCTFTLYTDTLWYSDTSSNSCKQFYIWARVQFLIHPSFTYTFFVWLLIHTFLSAKDVTFSFFDVRENGQAHAKYSPRTSDLTA